MQRQMTRVPEANDAVSSRHTSMSLVHTRLDDHEVETQNFPIMPLNKRFDQPTIHAHSNFEIAMGSAIFKTVTQPKLVKSRRHHGLLKFRIARETSSLFVHPL